MDEKEIRLRCIEAAAGIIPLGPERVVDAAEQFYAFVNQWDKWPTAEGQGRKTLGLPKKE